MNTATIPAVQLYWWPSEIHPCVCLCVSNNFVSSFIFGVGRGIFLAFFNVDVSWVFLYFPPRLLTHSGLTAEEIRIMSLSG